MRVKAPADLYFPVTGEQVQAGDWVDVDEDIGSSLVAQGWESARSVAARKAARKKASATRRAAKDQAEPEPEPDGDETPETGREETDKE